MAGEIVHVEFPSANADRAQRFWSELFGWEFQNDGGEEMDYRMARISPTAGAAVYPSDGEVGHPKYYFDVDDIQATSARIRELGGEAAERMPVPGMGWFTACKDSEGNEFHLWQTDDKAS